MRWKQVLLILFNIILIAMLLLYWINPGAEAEFTFTENQNSNFSLGNNSVKLQFYEEMRFPDKMISYRIQNDCTLQKITEMEKAFALLSENTDLTFYPVDKDEEITINCKESTIIEDGLFIAGEGGPTSIINSTGKKIILHGDILLIKDSECETPNVQIHELLHVLGFDHSENKNNIMYPISRCKQEIGEEIINTINEIYKEPSLPDLIFEEINAEQNGRNLDINLSVRNIGLKKSQESKIIVYVNGRQAKEMQLKPLDLGYGVKIELTNMFLTKTKIEELKLSIENDFEEISKDNNQIFLSKKN